MLILPNLVSVLFSSLLSELISETHTQISDLFKFRSELLQLIKTMQTIEDALDVIEKNPEGRFINERSLANLRDLVEEMNELSDATTRVRVSFLSSLTASYRYRKEAKRIKDTLKKTIADMETYKSLVDLAENNNGETKDPDDYETHASKPKIFIGRGSEKNKISTFLLNDQEDKFSFSIWGMGGLGKTYLAKSIVNEEKVRNKFEQILWIPVSRKGSKGKPIFKKILNMIESGLGLAEDSLESFRKIFKDRLKEKTLVVLDDLWKMDDDDWRNLRDFLDTGRNKVLITTRILKVVNSLDEELSLEPLSMDESWSLFKEHAPRYRPIVETPFMKKIVTKCEGLPDLVRAFALLHYNGFELADLVRNEIWSLVLSETAPDEVMNILQRLKRSYDYLEPHIKGCFVYCAVCVHPLDRERVAQMWIAQRFIRSTRKDGFEDTANGYWNKLVSASFIRAVEMNDSHHVTEFLLPPLVRDLAMFLSAKEYSISDSNVAWNSSHVPRHVSLSQEVGDFQMQFDSSKQKLLRTFSCRRNMELPDLFFSNFRNLRVMDLNGMNFKVLPSSIKSLRHLRYVDISENKFIESLPSSIGDLHNLETLRVDNCEKMVALPKEIRSLRKLRNLYISCQQESLKAISGIASLRTLQLVKCTCLTSLPDMQKFTLLKNLGILDCEVLQFAGDGMKGLKRLQSLTMVNLPELSGLPSGLDDAKDSLESLYFVGCSKLNTSPEWFASFNLLQRLTIKGCPKLSQTLESNHVKHVNNIWLDGKKYSPGSSNSPSSSSDARMTTHEQSESSNATGEDQAHGRIINLFEMTLLKFYDIIIRYVLKFFKRGSDVE